MTVRELIDRSGLEVSHMEPDRDAAGIYCCDLLSVAMARAPEDSVWVTVMGNRNVVAVAALTDVACVVLAEGFQYDADALEAASGKVTLLRSPAPVYETALQLGRLL